MPEPKWEGFDICYQCGKVQTANTMQDINEVEFDISCDECFQYRLYWTNKKENDAST